MDGLKTIQIEEALLSKNRTIAERLRARLQASSTLAVNVLSSPGSGKTALLERTLADIDGKHRAAVIVGDLATENDGRRLAGRGAPVVQIETGGICHLDAAMIERAVGSLPELSGGVLFIENVGNLVCPTAYDLGEAARVVLLSVTEGEDKPLKYPSAFSSADLVLITKSDLAEAVAFDRQTALDNIARMSPSAVVLEISARTGEGMGCWYRWLTDRLAREAR